MSWWRRMLGVPVGAALPPAAPVSVGGYPKPGATAQPGLPTSDCAAAPVGGGRHQAAVPPPAGAQGDSLASSALPPRPDRFARCVAEVLRHEGGLADHPADPGGITNLGITLAALRAWEGDGDLDDDGRVGPEDVRRLTPGVARAIYRTAYWNALRCVDLPAGVDLAVFDWGVNAGVGRAARGLQASLGVATDGAVGPVTLAAARRAAAVPLIHDLCDRRLRHLRSLSHWPVFGRGWTDRVEAVRRAAVRDAGEAAAAA